MSTESQKAVYLSSPWTKYKLKANKTFDYFCKYTISNENVLYVFIAYPSCLTAEKNGCIRRFCMFSQSLSNKYRGPRSNVWNRKLEFDSTNSIIRLACVTNFTKNRNTKVAQEPVGSFTNWPSGFQGKDVNICMGLWIICIKSP